MLGVAAPANVADLKGSVAFIATQIPAATELWIGGREAEGAIPETPPARITFLQDFQAIQPHLQRLIAAFR